MLNSPMDTSVVLMYNIQVYMVFYSMWSNLIKLGGRVLVRKSILIFCVFFVATFMVNVSAYANYAVLQVDNPKMSVNGELQTIEVAPVIQNGNILVPVFPLAKAVGDKVEWNGNERKITIKVTDMVTTIRLYKTSYTVKGNHQAGHEFMSRLQKYLAENENVKLQTAVENLGGKFDASEFKVLLDVPYIIDLWIDKTIALVNNEEKKLDIPPVMIKGHAMIPLRLVVENSGLHVKWVETDKRIIISSLAITPEFEASIVYPPAIEKPKPAPETKQSNQNPSNSGGDPRLNEINRAADSLYEIGIDQLKIDRSSAYNILNQALSTYNQTISIANQLGLSNDPATIHARNRINEIRRIMR